MTRRFITQFGEREAIDEIFLAADKQVRANRNGNLYLQVRLTDKTGSMNGMLWNVTDQIDDAFHAGDYVKIQGTTQFYNGALQVILSRVERIDSARVDESDFITLSSAQVERFVARLTELLRGMRSYPLRNLAECFLVDETFMARFTSAPAGIKNHHAYRGGLLEHVVSLLELVAVVAPLYPELNSDLLLMGAFLHDLGKVEELLYERELAYSDEGQLIGHLVIGVGMLNDRVRETERLSGEAFPRELQLRLQHMIVSHHGAYEFGSPKLPMTLEAIALHLLDNLDAKMHGIGELMRTDANSDSAWTAYQANLGRKLFKGELK